MVKWKDFLEKEHFDIHDIITWTEVQAVKCEKKDHKIIYQKFSRLLNRLKEDRRKIFDERFMEPEEPKLEVPKPPGMQRIRHKLKNVANFGIYKELLRKRK